MELTRHFQPHFKPDFNQEYLRSNNYICHFFVVRRSIALEVGGFREEFDGAQDHDFIFRCTEKSGADIACGEGAVFLAQPRGIHGHEPREQALCL